MEYISYPPTLDTQFTKIIRLNFHGRMNLCSLTLNGKTQTYYNCTVYIKSLKLIKDSETDIQAR